MNNTNMKLESVVVAAKLFCVFAGTSLLTLQTGLGQWKDSEKPPTTIQWVMVVGGSLGTGLTAAGAFLSNAFGNYMNNVNINGNGTSRTPPRTPPVESIDESLTEYLKDDKVPPVH